MFHAVCSVQTPKSVRRGGTGRELDGAGKGEGEEKRWERSRRMRLRGGEKRGGDGLTTSKGRWERVGEERALWEGVHSQESLSFCF